MARETWLSRLKNQLTQKLNTKLALKKTNLGILSFEIATLMSKLIHLHQSLSEKSILHLKNQSITLEGIRKLVSNDESFLLALACAEMLNNLNIIAKSVSWISQNRCHHHDHEAINLGDFRNVFNDFAETGRDPYNWVVSGSEVDGLIKKADRYVNSTSVLFREMEELVLLENSLKKAINVQKGGGTDGSSKVSRKKVSKEHNVMEIQQKVQWQKQEVKYMKEKSLWNRNFDSVIFLLAKLIFTILARIKLVFGIGHGYIATLPRSLSTSSAIYPSASNLDRPNNNDDDDEEADKIFLFSGPLKRATMAHPKQPQPLTATPAGGGSRTSSFFESNTKVLKPPSTTLGGNGLALHYANLIIVLEKMVKSPQLVGLDARDDLYGMLPNSIRSSLRGRLRGVGFSASDPVLATEWRDALGRILGWLGPLAHNMIKWQSERSFEQQNDHGGGGGAGDQHHNSLVLNSNNNGLGGGITKNHVLLLQTLYFANKDKTEAAITELLVGLNYIWRYDREMNAKALFECSPFFNLQQQQQQISCYYS